MTNRIDIPAVLAAALLLAPAAGAQVADKPGSTPATAAVTLTGCLVRADADGRVGSGAAATKGGGGFILRVGPGSTSTGSGSTGAASAARTADSAPAEYQLVAKDAGTDLAAHVGHRIAVTGTLAAADLAPTPAESGVSSSRPSGSTGETTLPAGAAPADPTAPAKGATADAHHTRPKVPVRPTLTVTTLRMVADSCKSPAS